MQEWLGLPQLQTFWKKNVKPTSSPLQNEHHGTLAITSESNRIPSQGSHTLQMEIHPALSGGCSHFAFTAVSYCTSRWTTAELSINGSGITWASSKSPFNFYVEESSPDREAFSHTASLSQHRHALLPTAILEGQNSFVYLFWTLFHMPVRLGPNSRVV